jgi:hypothetical protein
LPPARTTRSIASTPGPNGRWQLTCRIFHTPEKWESDFKRAGYTGDHEFIFFE